MGREKIVLTGDAEVALEILAQQIKLARFQRGETAEQLATRAGVSRRTILQIEKAEPAVSIGNVLKVALMAGVPLFAPSIQERESLRAHGREKIALLPSRVSAVPKLSEDELDF